MVELILNAKKETAQVDAFPIDLLPNWMKIVVNEHSESYGTPKELWAVAFLCGISSAVGKKIRLKTGNFINYPQLWTMVIARSGDGKSEPFKIAFKRLNEKDSQRLADYQSEYRDWERNDKQGRPPHWKHSLINDTTPEALFETLSRSENGISLYRDELSGWFNDFGRYNKSGEIGHYLSIFDNTDFNIIRKNGQPISVREPFLNIIGTIQPAVLEKVLARNDAESSGLAQRFLYLYPEFQMSVYNRQPVNSSTYFIYENVIDELVKIEEKEMYLAPDAENEYENYFNELEKARSTADDFWASVYAKAKIQALRLALIVKIARIYDNSNRTFIEFEDMKCAIGMMRYFINSLYKFKSETKSSKKTSDIIKDIYSLKPDASPTEIGKLLGVSKQYVSKVYKVDKLTVDSAPNSFIDDNTEDSAVNH